MANNKTHGSLVLVAGTVFVCFCLYGSTFKLGGVQGPWISTIHANKASPSSSSSSSSYKGINDVHGLTKTLREASMDDKTVIITTLNAAWSEPNSMLDLFLESFSIGEQTSHLVKHLVVVAMDHEAFKRCKALHLHCYFLHTNGVDFSGEQLFMKRDYLKMMWRRTDFLRIVLELGYNFIFTDMDVMWLRNPLSQFPAGAHLTIACDYFNGNPNDMNNWVNGGFLYVKSNAFTIEFYKYWYMARTLHPNSHEQQVFNQIKRDPYVQYLGIEMTFLDTDYFGGFCQPSRDLSKVRTMHANCCVGMEAKLHDLRVLIQDWKNYTSGSVDDRRTKGGFGWRVPMRCKA